MISIRILESHQWIYRPDSAAVAMTTTDSSFYTILVGGTHIRIGGMAKRSGLIRPNMATMLDVITTDAFATSDGWRKMVRVAVNCSLNQITVRVSGASSEAEAAKVAR
ncbi:arginine biosynthesis bifunctional, chloroplastic-like [Olea europaea subsp. europaea]|uniref:Arginine biosynthesis bifunctional, chloroplastic-like n=1 Tax=Olea europaea subsp. europaea TaxID=158383 RepID=A0A8S0QAU7_OLEEU|nr:arginine biosynthesis bifunctional, chloroplastic-like [Olea europaea subsp. europaea]